MVDSEFFRDLKKYFGKNDLYKVYDLNRNCTTAQIKKSYKKLSLLFHPDRNDESKKEESKIKFQLVSKIHLILSDKDKRGLYDEFGTIEESFNDDDFKNWEDYWRAIYPKITLNEINKFEAKYKNSEEERNDLKKYYLKFQGDLNKIMIYLMFYDVSEENRYREIINDLIKCKEVPAYNAFINETQSNINKRKRKAEKENKEFHAKSSSGDFDLSLAILQNNKNRETKTISFFDQLEAKYAPKKKNKKK